MGKVKRQVTFEQRKFAEIATRQAMISKKGEQKKRTKLLLSTVYGITATSKTFW